MTAKLEVKCVCALCGMQAFSARHVPPSARADYDRVATRQAEASTSREPDACPHVFQNHWSDAKPSPGSN